MISWLWYRGLSAAVNISKGRLFSGSVPGQGPSEFATASNNKSNLIGPNHVNGDTWPLLDAEEQALRHSDALRRW